VSKKALTPAMLARELDVEIDDVLLLLWDGGIEYPTSPESRIKPGDVARARAACGFASLKDKVLVSYWTELLQVERSDLEVRLGEMGVKLGAGARRLPKGALAKLEKAYGRKAVQTAKTQVSSTTQGIRPLPALEWRVVGHLRDRIRHLSPEEIENIHFQIADDFKNTPDPIAPAGVRSRSLLESAAARSSTGLGGYLKYPSVEMGAAALAHSIINNHPFFNGNKRSALVSMLVFLDENGLVFSSSQNEIFKWTIRVASHKLGADQYTGDRADAEVLLMSRWIAEHSRVNESGERVITFANLRRRLQEFGCTVEITGSGGGKAVVEREVQPQQRGRFGITLRSQRRRFFLPYGGDGRQVSRARIKELRRELGLSESDGFDSASFYGVDKQPVDSFIASYRKVLARLAKV
jgi:death-on-curing family protein